MTSILTCGTLVDGNHLKTNNSNYCISFKITEISGRSGYTIGASFVDASSAKFFIVDFEDDSSLVMLSTLFAQLSPKEIIVEKVIIHVQRDFEVNFIFRASRTILLWNSSNRNALTPHLFIRTLSKNSGIKLKLQANSKSENISEPITHGPIVLKQAFENNCVSFSAFGSLVSYLRVLKLDYELLSYGDVSLYEIMKQSTTMVVDGQTVDHLSVCSPLQDQRNTLLGIIDRCSTPFGHRRLRSWLMHPLYLAEDIKCRQRGCLLLNWKLWRLEWNHKIP